MRRGSTLPLSVLATLLRSLQCDKCGAPIHHWDAACVACTKMPEEHPADCFGVCCLPTPRDDGGEA